MINLIDFFWNKKKQMKILFTFIFLISQVRTFMLPRYLNSRIKLTMYGSNAKNGIFSPIVNETKKILGEKKLNEIRAKIILQHSKVISQFVDTSDTKFGKIALKCLFEAADKNKNGKLEFDEIKSASKALGFTWIDDDKTRKLIISGDINNDEIIDFEEFVNSAPKVLRTNLVKLAKKNGNDLGFLV